MRHYLRSWRSLKPTTAAVMLWYGSWSSSTPGRHTGCTTSTVRQSRATYHKVLDTYCTAYIGISHDTEEEWESFIYDILSKWFDWNLIQAAAPYDFTECSNTSQQVYGKKCQKHLQGEDRIFLSTWCLVLWSFPLSSEILGVNLYGSGPCVSYLHDCTRVTQLDQVGVPYHQRWKGWPARGCRC